jgi:uncharacterized protein
MDIVQTIAQELAVQTKQVAAAIQLLDEGATVPFIARYRKEVTGGLDDTQLRNLEERLIYLRDLNERRDVILKSIAEQEKLTPELEQQILAADNKARLEDLYLPYKPKRRTKAQIAKEAGLEPLAVSLLENPDLNPNQEAEKYLNAEHNINDVAAALDGAKQILMEKFAEDAELNGKLREYVWQNAQITSQVHTGKEQEGAKFKDYFAFSELLKKIPSHRALALFRGQREEILRVSLSFDAPEHEAECLRQIAERFGVHNKQRAADNWLQEVVSWTWKIKLWLKLEVELMVQLRQQAELEAIKVFSINLKDLLMASPAGSKVTMGLDPAFRTGVKVAVVDATGKLVAYTAIFPHEPRNDWDKSIHQLAKLCQEHKVQLISIGNGTASRETDKLAIELIQKHPELKLTKIVVSEAGASVYSASELAAKEFPELDVSYRGAVSIARRLQDPLAELVKIEPKAIGVGQYQHDVNQVQLARTLDNIVEDCVNAVGVDVNTASAALLSHVSGLNSSIAENIVMYRNQHGAFSDRQTLKAVPRFGEKTFEQAAGFLRIVNGTQALDASAVHPEAYPVVEKILKKLESEITTLIGNGEVLRKLSPKEFTDEKFGLPTVTDILKELEKPGRDPRPEFKTAVFQEDVHELSDLKVGMVLEGVVTNVTEFGAFVDIGVHQDGLVHKSALADRYVKDPREVVHVGKIVKVRVLEVDLPRKRISLTMRSEEAANKAKAPQPENKPITKKAMNNFKVPPSVSSGFGDALMDALKKR